MNRPAASVDDELVEHCLEGNVEGLEQYLSAGNFGKINHGDEKTGDSPLHLAALSPVNSFELSRLLLDFGANPCRGVYTYDVHRKWGRREFPKSRCSKIDSVDYKL